MSRESTTSQCSAALKIRVLTRRPASNSAEGLDVMSVKVQNLKQRESSFTDLSMSWQLNGKEVTRLGACWGYAELISYWSYALGSDVCLFGFSFLKSKRYGVTRSQAEPDGLFNEEGPRFSWLGSYPKEVSRLREAFYFNPFLDPEDLFEEKFSS